MIWIIWIFKDGGARPAAILNLIEPETAAFDLATRQPHEVDRTTRRWDIAIRNFVNERSVGRSLVDRQYLSHNKHFSSLYPLYGRRVKNKHNDKIMDSS